MRHLKFCNSFSFYRPARLIYTGELPQLITQLQSYRREAAENLNKKKLNRKKPTFTLTQLRQLRKKFETEYTAAGLASEKVQEKMKIIDEKLRLPEAFVLDFEKAFREITDTATDALLAELVDNGLSVKAADREKYRQEVEEWIDTNITDFEGLDTGDNKYTNKTRQALYGFLLAARLTLGEEDPGGYRALLAKVKSDFVSGAGSRYDFQYLQSLKLYGDSSDNAGHACDWWLYSEKSGLKSIGLSLSGYEDENYLTGLLMAAEHYFNATGSAPAGEQLYDLYKANMMAILKRFKPQLQRPGIVSTNEAIEAASSGWHFEDWNSDRTDFEIYKENMEAQRKIIHENIPTPQEWFEALKAGQASEETPGPLQPPTPGPGGPSAPSAPRAPERASESWDGVDALLKECWKDVLTPYTLRWSLTMWAFPFAYLLAKKPELTQFPKNEQLLIMWGEAMKHDPKKFGDEKNAKKLMEEAKVEFKTRIIPLLKEFQTEMPKRYEAVKDKLDNTQRTKLEAILEKLKRANFDSFDFNEFKLGNPIWFEFATLYYKLMGTTAPAIETATVGTAGGGAAPAGEGEAGGDTDEDEDEDEAPVASASGSPGDAPGGTTSSGGSGSGKPPEKPEEGPSADEMRKDAAKYCTLDKYYRVTFSSKKAEKVLRLHDRFSPENGRVLMVIPSADIGKAKIARFDSEDRRYEYGDGKPAKFMNGYQVLQGFSEVEIVRRYEVALTHDMPRDIDAAAKYVGKRYEQLKNIVATGFDARLALAILETTMARLDGLLKNVKCDSYRLDLVPDFSVEWKNPGAGGERRQGYKLEDVARVGYVFGVGKAAETSGGDSAAGTGGESAKGVDNMVLPSLDESPAEKAREEPEKTPEGLPENEKKQLQTAFSTILDNFVKIVQKGVNAPDDSTAYQEWLGIDFSLRLLRSEFQKILSLHRLDHIELKIEKSFIENPAVPPPKKIAFYLTLPPNSFSSLECPSTTFTTIRDFAYFAGMISDAKKDTPYYKFIERVERYMAEFKEE